MPSFLSVSRWFQPESTPCPVCGNAVRSASKLLLPPVPIKHPDPRKLLAQLCGDCQAAIPWILRAACPICGRPEACGDCARRRERHFAVSRSAVRYDSEMKDWLALYKYRGHERLDGYLSAILAFAFERLCSELRQPCSFFHAVTFVPLARERLEDRGFNQAERLAAAISRWYGLPCLNTLRRLHHTEKQSLKSRRNRIKDMEGNFAADMPTHLLLARPHRLPPKSHPLISGQRSSASSPRPSSLSAGFRPRIRLLLIDDIYTTGSTLNECARVLLAAGQPYADIRVYGLLWARS